MVCHYWGKKYTVDFLSGLCFATTEGVSLRGINESAKRLGLLLGCVLQLLFPFLTQAIVDVGIRQQDIGFVYLILLGQLMLVLSRTAVDFIRRWILLHISVRINISLVSDFFIKLLKRAHPENAGKTFYERLQCSFSDNLSVRK